MSSRTCRACGKVEEKEFSTFLTDNLSGKRKSYKSEIEAIIGSKLKSGQDISHKVCDLCKNHINLISLVRSIWKKNENSLTTTVSQQTAELSTPATNLKRQRIKSEPDGERSFFFYEKRGIVPVADSAKRKTKSFFSLQNVKELFAKELAFKDVLKDLPKFAHIQVSMEHVFANGEVSNDFLKNFGGTKRWSEFKFLCEHCNENIEGLLPYMDHMREAGIKTFQMKCIEEDCSRRNPFSALYSFINHVSEHNDYLAMSCVFCSPTRIFYNMPCLLNHYIDCHTELNFAFYMCLECGTYCQSITQLRVHKMSVHDKVQEIDESETDSSDEEGVSNKKKRSFSVDDTDWNPLMLIKGSNALRQSKSSFNLVPKKLKPSKSQTALKPSPSSIYHPKVRDVSGRRTYPCTVEGCNRVLVTPGGFEYHMLTHTGEKPFACRFCTARFRSKPLVDSHENTKHKSKHI